MNDMECRAAAKKFAADWKGRGDEKQDTQAFWMSFLSKVFGIPEPEKMLSFESRVMLEHVSFIDGYIKETGVLIEQKSADIDLRKGEKQSDGAFLTPYQQARRYAGNLPHDLNPRWIVVCNFQQFDIHDMNRPNDTPETVYLENLEKEYTRLRFLVDTGDENIKKEMEVSLKAGELVGVLYDALLRQYTNPDAPETLKSLNMLCVRLVFFFYAEDAGVFGRNNLFHDYMAQFNAQNARRALRELFRVLDQKENERDPYLKSDDPLLASFPYVNGGLFSDENIDIPPFTDEILDIVLNRASADFDWSVISPTIFGAVFESTLNPETRRAGGMHYTSIENIHKVIDPLFLNELRSELENIKAITVDKTRDAKLREYQNKLAGLKFLDPACGSGNFLTETYLSLRRLENETISLLNRDQVTLDMENPIKVSISQFYGIEINDFAVTVAKTALWIAESQMMMATEDVIQINLDFLPLKTNAHIVEGNALRTDWETVVPKNELKYIMGNPPFVGARMMDNEQKKDVKDVFPGWKNAGNLDYVACWYKKASDLMQGTSIHAALVSTNSVTQGESVANLWKPLFEAGIHIDYAHRTFRWDSEAKIKAHVHCVIIGFSHINNRAEKVIYTSDREQIASHINAYLLEAPDIFVESRKAPLCRVPEMLFGSMPNDNGNLILNEDEANSIQADYPQSKKYIKLFLGAEEFINNKKRYCLWLVGANPSELRIITPIMERIADVKKARESSKRDATKKLADTPTLFGEIRQPTTGTYLLVPSTSSEKRKYIPMGFFKYDVISSNANLIVPNAGKYEFGILESNVHMAWMRTVCGRLESRYRYSAAIVYNSFPWPMPTDEQRAKIEQTAQAILDARALYPDSSLADLYDEVTMPPELRRAHQENDKAVMKAYGYDIKTTTEESCVVELMKMYQKLTETK